jgi:hypothetical protein
MKEDDVILAAVPQSDGGQKDQAHDNFARIVALTGSPCKNC